MNLPFLVIYYEITFIPMTTWT